MGYILKANALFVKLMFSYHHFNFFDDKIASNFPIGIQKRRNVEIRNLKTFSKIAELGSFTKAAQELGYAQSTLTFQIQAIESFYNRPLFEKTGRTIQLTAFGRQLLDQVNSILSEYDSLEQLAELGTAPQGNLHIGAPDSLMMYRLYPIIKAYKATYPQVEISVINSSCELLRKDLFSGKLDLSFLIQPDYSYQNLNIHLLHEEPMCLVAPADHKREDFLPEPTQMVLFTEKECTYRQEFDRYLQENKYFPNNVLETDNVEAIKRYVINGLGVSYLPYYAVHEEVSAGLLRAKISRNDVRFFTQLAYHKKKWLSPAIQSFIELSQKISRQWESEREEALSLIA